MVTTTPTHFKVKVNTNKGSSYWTLSGSTTIFEDAAVFTMASMSDFFDNLSRKILLNYCLLNKTHLKINRSYIPAYK